MSGFSLADATTPLLSAAGDNIILLPADVLASARDDALADNLIHPMCGRLRHCGATFLAVLLACVVSASATKAWDTRLWQHGARENPTAADAYPLIPLFVDENAGLPTVRLDPSLAQPSHVCIILLCRGILKLIIHHTVGSHYDAQNRC